MIKEMRDLIPTRESIRRRSRNHAELPPPSQESLEKMDNILAEYGYDNSNREVYKAICEYGALMMDGSNYKGLFLKGTVGIGKSFGVEILAEHFKIPVFTPGLLISCYKNMNGDPEAMENIVRCGNDFWGKPHDIVIDELGTQDFANHFGEKTDLMVDILDMRYRAYIRDGVQTIVTTNLNDSELLKRYGTRINDRMNEMFVFRSVTGRSKRR